MAWRGRTLIVDSYPGGIEKVVGFPVCPGQFEECPHFRQCHASVSCHRFDYFREGTLALLATDSPPGTEVVVCQTLGVVLPSLRSLYDAEPSVIIVQRAGKISPDEDKRWKYFPNKRTGTATGLFQVGKAIRVFRVSVSCVLMICTATEIRCQQAGHR